MTSNPILTWDNAADRVTHDNLCRCRQCRPNLYASEESFADSLAEAVDPDPTPEDVAWLAEQTKDYDVALTERDRAKLDVDAELAEIRAEIAESRAERERRYHEMRTENDGSDDR